MPHPYKYQPQDLVSNGLSATSLRMFRSDVPTNLATREDYRAHGALDVTPGTSVPPTEEDVLETKREAKRAKDRERRASKRAQATA